MNAKEAQQLLLYTMVFDSVHERLGTVMGFKDGLWVWWGYGMKELIDYSDTVRLSQITL